MSITLKHLGFDDGEQTIKFNKEKVKVKKYLTVEDKITFRDIVLAQCFKDGVFDWIKFDMIFICFALDFYTDIKLPKTKSDSEDGTKILDFYTIYNIAKTTGVYKKILSVCGKDINELEDMIISSVDEARARFVVSKSTGSVLESLLGSIFNIDINEAGKVIDQISKISDLKNFDILKNALESNILDVKQKDDSLDAGKPPEDNE